MPLSQNSQKRFTELRQRTANLMGINAVKHTDRIAQQIARNQEAEGAWTRKHLWGEDSSPVEEEDDDMGHTVLGDITAPPVIVTGQQSSMLGPLLAGAALMGLPIAGVGGAALAYNMLGKKAAEVRPLDSFEYEQKSIGLGQIEDYK